MQTIEALQEQIEALQARIEAIENALQIQPPELEEVTPEENPNKEQARRQYEAAHENDRIVAEHIPDEVIKECIEKLNSRFPFASVSDLHRVYSDRCFNKRLTPLLKKYFVIAANRAGYPKYNYCGKACIWISDTPKPQPGKRAKKKT